MINLTFASFKNPREAGALKQQIAKKHELLPTTFKALHDLKEKSATKRLDNQENTLTNTICPRKNIVKVDKSSKKTVKAYKSPYSKNWPQSISGKQWQQSLPQAPRGHHPHQSSHYQIPNYQSSIHHKHSTYRQQTPLMMTPNLAKNNRSMLQEQIMNSSFFTQHNSITASQQGSVSSSKNSFNDSFQNHAVNVSYEDDISLRDKNQMVNSSLELHRQISAAMGMSQYQHPKREQLKTMKKSTNIFMNGTDSILKQLDIQSNCSSVVSSAQSIKFSQKFKHYKKRQSLHRAASSFTKSDFKLQNQLGTGKYGKVYLARHIRSGFLCALKSVSKKLIKEQKLQIPFIRQIKIQFYLNHPNIVQLYGIFHDSENIYLIMEYCSHGHLLKQIKNRRSFQESEILLILSNIYEAVSYIHCNGVIHRDLKPENIVIQHGVYKLCDFGWAAYACGDTRTTFCGTPLYVSPQVLKGEEYNQKADIWGLGIVTYELTFGRVPFPILSQTDLMKIIKDPVYFPVWGQASQKLVPVVRRMLSKNASQRPSLNEILSSELFAQFRDSPDPGLRRELNVIF